MSDKIIGIDLGTTNSAMSVLEGGQPSIITNSDGDRTTPSVVAFKDGSRIVGKTALRQQVTNVHNTVYSVKRFIGRTYDELTPQDREGLAYTVERGDQGRPVIMVDADGDGADEALLPEQISAAVLAKLKDDASAFLGEEVTKAVITVPAYFNDTQRQATKDAGKIAGLDVQRIINEPTAAALAYGFGQGDGGDKMLMVFDLGGGTLDISILSVSEDFVEVKATAGDNHLGGDLWDSAFAHAIEERFLNETGKDLSLEPMNHARVLEACRAAKHDLSNAGSTDINLPFIGMDANGAPLNMLYTVTRDEFDDITRELTDRCRKPVEEAVRGMAESGEYPGFSFADIDEVLLVGGSTRMPQIKDLVREISGKEPEMTVNPDEAVSLGACVQGGVLNGECRDIVLADVVSMSLGLKSYRNGDPTPHVTNMIKKNTLVPTEAKKSFTTREDNQESVEIILIQGEADSPDDPENKVLGRTTLSGIPPMPAREPEIEITVSYDTENMIQISARELKSGTSIQATISGTTRLSDDEVEQLAASEQDQL